MISEHRFPTWGNEKPAEKAPVAARCPITSPSLPQADGEVMVLTSPPLSGGGEVRTYFSTSAPTNVEKTLDTPRGNEKRGNDTGAPSRRILCPFCGNPTRCLVCSSHPGDQSPERAAEEAAATCRGLYPHQARTAGKETPCR